MVNCLIQVFMGAVSGYYTNKLAISHLFTDIPLPGGNSWKAVIKKGGNKEKLAEDLSEIADDKILGSRPEVGDGKKKDSYLYQELSKAEVVNALDQCIEEIFQELQNSNTARKSLVGILEDFLKQDVGQYRLLEQSLLTAAAGWTIGDLIGEETFTAFCGELWHAMSSQEKNRLDEFIESIFWELSQGEEEITLEAVLGREICERAELVLAENIGNIFGETLFAENDSARMKMEGHLHSICRQIGFGNIVRNFLISLREKKVGDLVSVEGEVWLSEKLRSLLGKTEVKENLRKLFEIFMENLKQANWKLSDLLPEGCLENEKLLGLLADQIRDLQPFAGELYKENREFISERLNRELSGVIEEGTGNFLQNMVLLSAKDTILEKLGEFLEERMPIKIQSFMENPSREACLEICRGIGRISVSELAEKIEFDSLYSVVEKALYPEKEGMETSGYLMQKIKDISLATVIDHDMADYLSKKSDGFFTGFISEWLKGKEKKGQIEKAVHFLLGKLWRKPLRRQETEVLLGAIRKNSLSTRISGLFTRKWKKDGVLNENKTFFQWVYGQVSGITLSSVVPSVLQESPALLGRLMETYGNNLTVGAVVSSIPREPIKRKIRELFMEKAADYLPVRKIVKEKVLELDEDTLCEMMQKFMGKQLRPLNRIGGALGAMVGLLVFVVNPSIEMSLPMLVCAVVSYGLIGVVTNILALRGLFRPYHIKERKWLGRFTQKNGAISKLVMFFYRIFSKIPGMRNLFCLGYIPENRDMIAQKLAEFVAGNFLKPQDLLPEITLKPEMVQRFLEDHGAEIAEKAAGTLWKADWNPALKVIKNKISEGNFQEAVKGRIRDADISFLAGMVYPTLEAIQDQPLNNYVNPEKMAGGMTQILQKWAKESVHGRDDLQRWYEKEWKKKEVADFIPYFSGNGEEFWYKSRERILMYFYGDGLWKQAESMIVAAFSAVQEGKDKAIFSCFEGKNGNVLEKHMDSLELFLFRMLKRGCSQYLLNHEDDLVDKLDLEIQGMINDMADGMPLGGMAASMLGTRQIIAKVFHRTFIEPEVREMAAGYEETSGASEFFVEERLNDGLFDRNEERLLNKIGEIIKIQAGKLTIGDLEEILFAPLQEQLSDGQEEIEEKEQEKRQRKQQWSHQLCIAASEIWKQGRSSVMEPVNQILEGCFSLAGACTVGEYASLLRQDFVKDALEEKLLGGTFQAVQKPLVGQACTDFFRYILSSYVLSGCCGDYLSIITEDSLAVMLQNNWKRLCRLSCFDVFLSELLTCGSVDSAEGQKAGLSVLLKEAADSLKEKESVQEGCRKLIGGGMEILSGFFDMEIQDRTGVSNAPGQDMHRVIMEIIDDLNEALKYEKENRTTLVSVTEAIDFTRVICLAVMDMTDAQIEDLFQGFAGEYFLSLKLSGALGFVFGVPVVQWIAAAAALGSELVGKKKV